MNNYTITQIAINSNHQLVCGHKLRWQANNSQTGIKDQGHIFAITFQRLIITSLAWAVHELDHHDLRAHIATNYN